MKTKNTRRSNQSKKVYRKKSSPNFRAEVLEFADNTSIRKASLEYAIPEGTLRTWRNRYQGQARLPNDAKADESPSSVAASADLSKSHSKRGLRYPPALRAEILEYAESLGIAAAAKQYQVARVTIYQWRRRAIREQSSGVTNKGRSSSPEHQDPIEVLAEVISPERRNRAVLAEWKKNKGFGPSQIRNMLKRSGIKVSVGTVRNIMEENGYVRPKMKAKEPRKRYEASRPRELYHLDFYHFHVHKQKQVLLFIQDDFSRFIAGWALSVSETADSVIDAFERCVSQYGRPERVMSDRGSAFHSWRGLSRFNRMLEDYEINFHLATEPQKNGKVEALNAAFQKECLRQQEFLDLSDASRTIAVWVDHFNHQRTHHGLGGILVPADRFYGLVEKTLKMVESGHGADALSFLNPDSRGLELFRVVSQGGQPQVYLMGKKILG